MSKKQSDKYYYQQKDEEENKMSDINNKSIDTKKNKSMYNTTDYSASDYTESDYTESDTDDEDTKSIIQKSGGKSKNKKSKITEKNSTKNNNISNTQKKNIKTSKSNNDKTSKSNNDKTSKNNNDKTQKSNDKSNVKKESQEPAKPKKPFQQKIYEYVIKKGKFALKLGKFYADKRQKDEKWFNKNKFQLNTLLDAYKASVGHLFWGSKPLLPQNMTFDLKFFKFAFDDHTHYKKLLIDNDLSKLFSYGENTLNDVINARCIIYQIRLGQYEQESKKYIKEQEQLDSLYDSLNLYKCLSDHLVKGGNLCNYVHFCLLVGTFKGDYLWRKINMKYSGEKNYLQVVSEWYDKSFDLKEEPSRKIPSQARKMWKEINEEFKTYIN